MDRYVTHATFSLERDYPVAPARVFAAWADPAAKARWFAPSPDARAPSLISGSAAGRWRTAARRAAR